MAAAVASGSDAMSAGNAAGSSGNNNNNNALPPALNGAGAAILQPSANLLEMKKLMNYALVKATDMTEEMKADCIEFIVTAIEKYPANYESACRFLKETMDRKYGPSWHCFIGEGYGFEITHEIKHLIYCFFGGNLAILLFKGAN